MLDLLDERDDVEAEYRTAIGQERIDLANLGRVIDLSVQALRRMGAEDWMGEVEQVVYEFGVEPG